MGLFGSFFSKFSRSKASIEDLDEFKKVLIESDLGVTTADEIIDLVRREKSENLESAVTAQIKSFLIEGSREISTSPGTLTTILIVGVNGTGKTTSAAKLANLYKSQGKMFCSWQLILFEQRQLNNCRRGAIASVLMS